MRTAALLLLVLLLGACAAHRPSPPEALRQAERYMGLGVKAFGNDDYAGATAMFAKAQAVYRSMDHTEGMVQSGINLAESAVAVGSYERAQRQIAAVEPLAARTGKAEYVDRLLLLGAVAQEGRAQRAQALARLQRLLPEFGPDDAPGVTPTPAALSAIVLRTRMALAEEAPLFSQWTRRLERSLARAGGEDAPVRARLLRFQGEVARRNGERAAARARFEEALALYRVRVSRAGTAATLDELAALSVEEGRPDAAREYLERALFIQLWILDRVGAGASLHALSKLYAGAGETARAAQAQQWADALASEGEPDWKQMREQWAPSP